MKKIIVCLMIIFSSNTYAFDLKEVSKFIGGVASSYMIHEAGHYFAAEVTDTDIDVRWFEGNQIVLLYMEPESDSDGLYISSAGLVSQAMCSEVILDSKVNKDNSFVQGMMFWNVLNPIMYAADYWWIHRTNKIEDNQFQGDLSGIECYSDKKTANIFAGTMVLLALWHGYRFYHEDTWYNFTPIPVKDGVGFQFTYKF
jgi:hypothetical protein